MGGKNRAEVLTESCLREAFLFATMHMIGFPVDVHIRDGSVYSGVFHTASMHEDYDIVLKKAKLTTKGKCNANVADGSVVETLVILSRDIVQVVAKGVLFPSDAAAGNMSGDDVEAAVTGVSSSEAVVSEAKKSKTFTMDEKGINENKQIEDDWSQGEQDHCDQNSELESEKSADEVQNSNSIFPPVDVTSESESHSSLAASTDVVSSQSSEISRSSKEFKLNPGAKSFAPPVVDPLSVTPPTVPAVASMTYIPCNSHMAPVAVAQPEVGISPYAPHPSITSQSAPHSNLAAVNGVTSLQVSQPIVGHMESMTQPIRYGDHYYAVQTGPTYVPPDPQAIMVGRLGQVVYMHPVPNGFLQSTAAMSYPHQVQYPKHQGSAAGQALLYCLPPLAGGQQLFGMRGHIPLLQSPIPANHLIPVPRSNAPSNFKSP